MRATEQQKHQMKQYYQRKKVEILEERKAYYKKKRNEIRAKQKKYREENPEYFKEKERKRGELLKKKRLHQVRSKKCKSCGEQMPDHKPLTAFWCDDCQETEHKKITANWQRQNAQKRSKAKRIWRSIKNYGEYGEAHRALIELENQLKGKKDGTQCKKPKGHSVG